MKFTLLIAAVTAIRLQQKSQMEEAKGPTAAKIIEECDVSGNGELNKKEAHDCIDEHVPEEHQKAAHKFLDKVWNKIDASGNGEVSEKELANAMRKGGEADNLMQVAKGPNAKQIMGACDADQSGGITKDEAHACIDAQVSDEDMQDRLHAEVDETFDKVDADGSGEVDIKELRAGMKARRGGGRDGPSPKQIIDMCDTDKSGGLTKEEAHKCVDEHVSDEEMNKEIHDMIDSSFDEADKNGDGEVDRKELRRIMRKHEGKGNKGERGPSAKDIIEACDADKSGGLTKEEAHACIDEQISDEEKNKEVHDMVDAHFDEADKNGDGEVDRNELKAVMKAQR